MERYETLDDFIVETWDGNPVMVYDRDGKFMVGCYTRSHIEETLEHLMDIPCEAEKDFDTVDGCDYWNVILEATYED